MNQLDELYQTLILEHNRSPRNFRRGEKATGHAEGRNPLCGDSFEVWITIEGDLIADVTFLGQGCAISKASASMMTTAIRGKSVAEAEGLFRKFHEVVTGRSATDEESKKEARQVLGCLSAFAGVAAFPIRVKCATLAWHAMMKAIDEGKKQNPRELSRPMPYDERLVSPMRAELTRLGVKELKTVAEVDEALGDPSGTQLVFVNSVCGCAAGAARPALTVALKHSVKPSTVLTVFAGQDLDAAARARSYFADYQPSSPSVALMKDGEVVFFMHRYQIEGRGPDAIAADLIAAFDQHCGATV